jgi:hypothetical protein
MLTCVLRPLRIQSPPSRRADVLMALSEDAAPGSEIDSEKMISPRAMPPR